MSLFFNRIQRNNLAHPSAPKMWYPILKSIGTVKDPELGKLLVDETTLNAKEAEMAIQQLFKVITRLLLDGKTVQIGSLGTFYVRANAEGSATKEEAASHKIKKVKLHFMPSTDLNHALSKATFVDLMTVAHNTVVE